MPAVATLLYNPIKFPNSSSVAVEVVADTPEKTIGPIIWLRYTEEVVDIVKP
jgi:hypothetical protein